MASLAFYLGSVGTMALGIFVIREGQPYSNMEGRYEGRRILCILGTILVVIAVLAFGIAVVSEIANNPDVKYGGS